MTDFVLSIVINGQYKAIAKMTKKSIQEIGKIHLDGLPQEIIRMTIGMCNEVYELKYPSESFILRMNQEKEWIYGTHRFLPLFQKLKIKTPAIIVEDYSKTTFPFCYQIQSKLDGKDLGLVIHKLNSSELKEIAKEVSDIFDKFKTLPTPKGFGTMTGLKEEEFDSLLAVIQNQRNNIITRNKITNALDQDIIQIYDILLNTYKGYFSTLKPGIYYDDICSKNVMIHNGKFNGLVDLDFLIKGDYLEAIGRIKASWFGEEVGDTYIKEIINHQGLNEFQ